MRPTVHGQRLLELVRPLVAGLDSTREVLQQEGGAAPRQLTFVTNLRVLVEEVSRAVEGAAEAEADGIGPSVELGGPTT